MKRVNVIPRLDAVVLDEAGRRIPEFGASVPDTSFYRRMLRDGDLSVLVKRKVAELPPRKEKTQPKSED